MLILSSCSIILYTDIYIYIYIYIYIIHIIHNFIIYMILYLLHTFPYIFPPLTSSPLLTYSHSSLLPTTWLLSLPRPLQMALRMLKSRILLFGCPTTRPRSACIAEKQNLLSSTERSEVTACWQPSSPDNCNTRSTFPRTQTAFPCNCTSLLR